MYPFMDLKLRSFPECLVAEPANFWLLPCVNALMDFTLLLEFEEPGTVTTLK